MFRLLRMFHQSLSFKLILTLGVVLFISIFTWAYFNLEYQKKKLMKSVVDATDGLSSTIRLGTRYAMMLNSRDDINQIINNIGKQEGIENIRIYNKEGRIKFSNRHGELEKQTNIKSEACYICHGSEPPIFKVPLEKRSRIVTSPNGYRLLGVISPIVNEPGCATGDCHVHPKGKKILGALDVVVSLRKTDRAILDEEKGILGLALFIFLITSGIIIAFVMKFVNKPIKKLIKGTRSIARGDYSNKIQIDQKDEMSLLSRAINLMNDEIAASQDELNRQKNEYQRLFEGVPCLITVQDRNYTLLNYNTRFYERFNPRPNDFCFHAYKGLNNKCRQCPVEKTFVDGKSHSAEESGINKNGTMTHWIVMTSPIRDSQGKIIAAMEISLDISQRKKLEDELEKSEKKYHAIFSNMPNPVFVLDYETLKILDCNHSVTRVYGFLESEMIGKSFVDLFNEEERENFREKIFILKSINKVKQRKKDGKSIFVNIRISPTEYSDRKVLLVATSDITKRLEAEQQLIQASKMATLGEMATGVAHELNQPLSVIKTVSSFFIKKISNKESIKEDILSEMLSKVDGNVDRATKIINHMRQFARKSDLHLGKIQINDVIENAFEIFSQQLKVRGIEVVWEIQKDLPGIMADPGRLEQVFINLLLNARDAIEEKWETKSHQQQEMILINTTQEGLEVVCTVCDTGCGMDEKIAEKIFEPFFTTKEVGKGTGLGLSISYGIVKDCSGTIEAVPGKDGGTCFIIKFPIPQ